MQLEAGPDLLFSRAVAMENIHSEMYSLLIDTYVKDNEEKERLFTVNTAVSLLVWLAMLSFVLTWCIMCAGHRNRAGSDEEG